MKNSLKGKQPTLAKVARFQAIGKVDVPKAQKEKRCKTAHRSERQIEPGRVAHTYNRALANTK